MSSDKKILDYVARFISTNLVDDEVSKYIAEPQLRVYINDSLADLNQNGVGNKISLDDNPDLTWDDFFGETQGNRHNAITYVCANTIALFDPGLPSVISVMEKLRDKSLLRARLEVEYGG